MQQPMPLIKLESLPGSLGSWFFYSFLLPCHPHDSAWLHYSYHHLSSSLLVQVQDVAWELQFKHFAHHQFPSDTQFQW